MQGESARKRAAKSRPAKKRGAKPTATMRGAKPKPRARRGRPPNTTALTKERWDKIIAVLRGAGLPSEAADFAGVNPRTLREWVARGEGRSSRPATPRLKKFSADYRQAIAEARFSAAARAHAGKPEWWLLHAGRTTDEREGWTEHKQTSDGIEDMSPEEIARELDALHDQRLQSDPSAVVGKCSHPRCGCPFHRRR